MAAWYLADLISSDPEALWTGEARIDVAQSDGEVLFSTIATVAKEDPADRQRLVG